MGSWWQPLRDEAPFDLLVGNPPYVDPAAPDLVAAEVREHEPGEALWTPPGRPAAAYAEILAGVEQHLAPGAAICLETGVGAAEPALELLRAEPALVDQEIREDLAGLPRYLVARVRSRPGPTRSSAGRSGSPARSR